MYIIKIVMGLIYDNKTTTALLTMLSNTISKQAENPRKVQMQKLNL